MSTVYFVDMLLTNYHFPSPAYLCCIIAWLHGSRAKCFLGWLDSDPGPGHVLPPRAVL